MRLAVHVASLTLLGPRELRRIAVALIVAALFTLWIGRYSDIDLLLADTLFDTASNTFPWRHAWLTETFSHMILKWLLTLAALGFIGCTTIDAIWPLSRFGALDRLRIRIVALSSILVPVVISSLKQVSSSHCPWDLARYGGDQLYVRIFETLPIGAVPGHCLPAGHASSALWLLSLAVYGLPAQPRVALTAGSVGITFGALLGFMQQLRGAHFLTHTLWSIWIGCTTVVFAIVALQGRKAGLCRNMKRKFPNPFYKHGSATTGVANCSKKSSTMLQNEQQVSEFKSTSGLARIVAASRYSAHGLKLAWKSEHAFRQELLVSIPAVVVAALLPISVLEKLALVVVLALVLIVELLNSAIEAVVDRISLERHPLSKNAKDLGSAAVFLTVTVAAVTWATIVFPIFIG